jgi:1-acyl-sn-glycerol-3-phosphate acyltransferase
MSIFRHLLGVATTLLFIVTTTIAFIPLFPLALTKWLIPFPAYQKYCNRWLDGIARTWISVNSMHQSSLLPTAIKVAGDLDLRRDEWYLMIANHQSWVDILMLLRVFNHRIPYVKFFLKKSLIWVPLLGVAWWALDFPFMRRYTKAELARNPALKDRDIDETRRACEKYRHNPVTIINFLEGTRFTPEKHRAQASPYAHLLIPRAGGMAFALTAMDGQLHRLLDVTLYYPEGRPAYWDYACGRVKQVQMHVCLRPLPAEWVGDYANDAAFRESFQRWVNELWQEKDQRLAAMAQESTSH